jgi:predicted O-methyltransferase YrrM
MNTQAILEIYNENITDKEILGRYLQDKDANQPYLVDKNTYTWYYAISKALQPKVIAEIGCRFGYSLRSMLYGSPFTEFVYVWDNESYEADCLTQIEALLQDSQVKYQINKQDTQKLDSFNVELKVDLFHVDGDHSIQGTYYDLQKAYKCLSKMD